MRRALALAAVAAGALVSCGPDNGLGGSVEEIFPLDISRVEVARNQEALQVSYFFNRGVFLDVVARVSVSLDGVEVRPGVTIPLAGETDGGVLRCTVVHAPGGEPVRVLPHVHRGDMVIRQGGEIGGPIRGDFSMLFASDGGDLGGGRTLYGGFLTNEVLDAGFGELP
jgi:hypothetical protein